MNVYSLQSNDLKNLGPNRAIEFFRRLLWAEASRVGIGRNLIDVPDCINVGDGGLDAVIENATPASEEVIPSGLSGFQIKSSDLKPEDCRKELHQNKKLRNPLKPGIRRVLDSNGTYILVLFAEMPPETMKRRREKAIREELQGMGYSNPQIRVYTINQIISFAERFPALVAWLKGYPNDCLPYQVWAENRDVSIPKTFVSNGQRNHIIKETRERLRNPGEQSTVFRIIGLSGLGKTRLIFEALSPDDLKNKVIYVTANPFKNSSLLRTLRIDDNLEAIIVVDECSLQDHEDFVRYFSNRGPRLSLITISHEIRKVSPPTLQYQLGPLSDDAIKKLLSEETKGLPQSVIDRLADFADGYPRIAIFLAENYLSSLGSSTEDILAVNDESLINRLISGRIDPSSDWFRKTKKVLMGLALFEKVGYKEDLSSEAKWVSNLMGISWNDFQEIVIEQKRRGIIQGEYYIYVTPFLLTIYLVREWWETYGDTLNFEKFVVSISKELGLDMVNRFISHFPFIVTTGPGKNLVKKLLSKKGIFGDGSLLKTDIGAKFFLKLTEADPESALYCLKRTVGTWSKDELFEFKTGRREVVWALERIAIWKELFTDAARLLLALGEAENESYANNASGVFADLFSPAPGQVAPTEISPRERFPILIEAVNSDSIECKRLALRGFRSALQWGYFTRGVGAEYQGGKPLPKLWTPKTYKEIFDYYREVWTYLEENLGKFKGEVRDEALKILLESARGIADIYPTLSEMVRKTIRKLSSYPWIDRDKLLKIVLEIIHYNGEKLPENILKDWISLRDELTGSSFSDLLKRYVGMDLSEDYFHDGEHYNTKWVESKIRELAEKVIANPNLLEPEYSWLTTDRAKRGYQFGYELGKLDTNFSLLEKLIDKQRKTDSNGTIYFLGGYFKALFERNTSLWENKLELLSKDHFLGKFIPELTWRSGITDRAAKRILSMAKKGKIDINNFGIFRFGGVVKQISESVFIEWIKFLLRDSSGLGTVIALGLFHFYYVYGEKDKVLPKNLTLDLLLHSAFWDNPKNAPRDQLTEYDWEKTADTLIDQFPETQNLLADKIIEFFGDKRSIAGGFHSTVQKLLMQIVKRNPKVLWRKITKYLGPPIDERAFHLKEWLRGKSFTPRRSGALELFNPEDIWKWVEENMKTRASYLATFVPPYLFHSTEKVCLARELLVKYGNREDVRRNFSANYFSEGWTGPGSIHYMNKKKELLEFRKNETNKSVIKWINEYLEELEWHIRREKIEEEREG